MGRAGGAGGGHSGGGHSFGGGHSGGGRSSFSSGRSSSSSGRSSSSSGRSSSSSGRSSSSSGSFGSTSGSRSSGSIFSNSSRGGSSYSGGSSYGGGGFFGRRPPRENKTIIINNVDYNDSHHYNEAPNNTGNYGNVNNQRASGKGCLTAIAIIVIMIVFIAVLDNMVTGGDSSDITVSSVEREPLPAGSVNETEYYTDELGWIGNQTELEKGMKNFFHATGVQPYLYITDNVNGNNISDVDELGVYAESLYQQLFTDEAHMLLVFYEYNGEYADYYLCGSQAKTVVDREAGDILLDYIDKYYYYDDISDEEFFSTVFDKTATRIMTVEESPWPMFWTGLITLIAIIAFFIGLAKFIRMKKEKSEQDAIILNTPLERFEDGELEELEKKYEDS